MDSHKKDVFRILHIAVLLTLLAELCFLALTTVYSADDFWYAAFLDNGVADWLQKMGEHYNTFNGRTLVHLAATLILHAGNWLFAAIVLCCCLGMGYLSLRLVDAHGAMCGVFLAGILLMPRPVMVEGMLWISACCNYLLPTAMIVFEMYVVKKLLSSAPPWYALAGGLILCFLCGATTEQSGLVSCAVCAETILTSFRSDRSKLKYGAAFFVCSALGLCTLFLSPATRSRFQAETGSSAGIFAVLRSKLLLCGAAIAVLAALFIFLAVRRRRHGGKKDMLLTGITLLAVCLSFGMAGMVIILGQRAPDYLALLEQPFLQQAKLAADCKTMLILLGILFPCLGVLYGRRTGMKVCAAAIAAMPTACLFGIAVCSEQIAAAAYCLLLLWMTVAAFAVWLSGLRETGVFLGLAVISVAVMIATNSSAYRTMLPFYLFSLCALTGVLRMLIPEKRETTLAASAIVLLLTLFYLGPQFPAYWGNYRLDRKNHESAVRAHETGELYYCVDYDMDYTYTKPFFDQYFQSTYLESEGLTFESCPVYYYSEVLPAVYVNGTRTRYPAALGENGEYVCAPHYTLPYTACEYQWLDARVSEIVWDGIVYRSVRNDEMGELSWTDAEGAQQVLNVPLQRDYYMIYYPLSVYRELWGLEITENAAENRIDITSVEE